MSLPRAAVAAIFCLLLSMDAAAQDARAVIAEASRAMGVDSLTSVTYAGTAANGNFGQSRSIGGPLQMTAITAYKRAIDFSQPASRASGPTLPPAVAGQPPPAPGEFNQLITPANAAWMQQLQIWVTPWGFLKGAAANGATVRSTGPKGQAYSIVTWSPAQKAPSGESYRVVGYLNPLHMVEQVETWVEHPVAGDLHIDTRYSGYLDVGGLKVPTKISQSQAGIETFTATLTGVSANPANIAALLAPPAPAGGGAAGGAPGGAPAPPPVTAEKLADGVYRITGGYVALAVEFKDHIVVIECGQSEARGQAVLAEARKAIPGKPIRYVVNTHAHFDHASGLAPVVAEGITIITQQDNQAFLQQMLGGPRTLVGDALAKSGRKPRIEAVREKRVLSDGTRTVELYHIQDLAHSDGMLVAYLPKERILLSADFNIPAAGQPANASLLTLLDNIDRLKIDFDRHVTVHALNPDRLLSRAELAAFR